MTAQEAIQQAYNITDRMQVSGAAVEQMAALRAALREAYAAAKSQTEEEEDGR